MSATHARPPATASTTDAPMRPRPAPGFEPVRSVGGIEEHRLAANGLRVLYMEWRAAPVALLMLTYDVGSRHEPAHARGASHMLEHLMFKGSADFNAEAGTSIFDLLQPVGAQTNATTWLDRTHYFDLMPVEHLDAAARIEADRMRGLRLAPSDLAAEREVVLNERDQCMNEPLEALNQAVWRTAFPTHPYGHPVIGSRHDILGLTREALRAHYDLHYRPAHATLTIIGDVARDEALALVRRRFEAIPAAGPTRPPDVAPEPPQRGERRVAVAHPGQPGWAMLAYVGPEGANPDVDALELLGGILLGSRSSRLQATIIATGLAAAGGCMVSRLRHAGLFQMQALLGAGQDHVGVERAMRDAVASIRRDGVTRAELDRARGRARGALLASRDGPLAMAMQLNEAIAMGDWTTYATHAARLDAVGVDDIQRVARRYLIDDALTVGHLVRTADSAVARAIAGAPA